MYFSRLLCALTLSLVLYSTEGRKRGRLFNGNALRHAGVPAVPAPEVAVVSRNGTQLPPYNTTYFFDQLIDHNNPSLGTFKQRFWHTYEFYEPGGPIILNTPGESNAAPFTGYLTNSTLNGVLAQALNGSTIVIEHRFFGLSNPYPDLSDKSLSVLNIQQAIDDLEYFAKNVNLPMPNGDQVTPDKAPWILIGGSYPGALTSWTMVNKPGLFQAGYASSAVVEAITDFWQYFEPVRQNMPANCSADVEAVIAHVDQVFTGTNTTAIQALKENWGMGGLSHLDDVAGALRNNLWDWQALQITSGSKTAFYEFCDALEVDANGRKAPASGFGLDHALAAWGKYWRTTYLEDLCGNDGIEDCLGTYDPTAEWYTDTTIDNSGRSWFWFVCNEVGYLQDSAPAGQPSLVSRIINPPYDYRQCSLMFPNAFPTPRPPNVAATNLRYRGWNVHVDGLFFANGVRDPWRYATLSVGNGDMFHSTPTQPIGLGDGFHCSDLLVSQGKADKTIAKVQSDAVEFIKGRVAAFRPKKTGKNGSRPGSVVGGQVGQGSVQGPVVGKPINAWFKPAGQVSS